MAFWNRKQTRSNEAPASTVKPPSWWLAGTYGGVTEVTGSTMALMALPEAYTSSIRSQLERSTVPDRAVQLQIFSFCSIFR